MSYENIRHDIEQDLINNGFELKENELVKTNSRKHQIVINGVHTVQEEKQEIKIHHLGEGYIDDKPTAGFSIFINEQPITDVWCTNLEDFKYLIQRL